VGSRNGTFVDGSRIQVAFVRTGTRVGFGEVDFSFADSESIANDSSKQETGSLEAGAHSSRLKRAIMNISPAERRVLQAVRKGFSEREIAARLNLSPHTVHNHIRSIFSAFEVHSRTELLAKLLELVEASDGSPSRSNSPSKGKRSQSDRQ
jgi:DNA-binding CsgD family transcriptional regulator